MTRVLLVEDNLTLLESLAFELSMRDYDVLQASDGQMALDVLKKADPLPDIIVSDIAMPDIDGYRLLEEVRGQEVWAAIPVILLTAFDSANAVRIGKDLGADDYLIKPVDPDDLIAAMENKLTRVKQIERHVEKSLDETRHELLSMISHELRSPLTSIHGSTEVLAERLNDVPDALTTKMLDILRMGSYRMNRLANRIVSMVQIESGYLQDQLANHSEVLNINDVINAALDEIRKLHNTTDRIQVTLADNPTYIKGNGGYLQLMISELIDNAIKFSPPQSPVTVRVDANADHVEVTVQNVGNGISKNKLEAVWDALRRNDYQRNDLQTIGLGLSLVLNGARIHGGSLTARSESGEGALMVLSLPRIVD